MVATWSLPLATHQILQSSPCWWLIDVGSFSIKYIMPISWSLCDAFALEWHWCICESVWDTVSCSHGCRMFNILRSPVGTITRWDTTRRDTIIAWTSQNSVVLRNLRYLIIWKDKNIQITTYFCFYCFGHKSHLHDQYHMALTASSPKGKQIYSIWHLSNRSSYHKFNESCRLLHRPPCSC